MLKPSPFTINKRLRLETWKKPYFVIWTLVLLNYGG